MFKDIQIKYILGLVIVGVAAVAIGFANAESEKNSITSNLKNNLENNLENPNNIAQAEPKPKVVASHNVICDLVGTIAQDTIELTCLMDANQDPHTYKATPSDLKVIEEAQLIFYGGYQLEPQITKLLTATKNPKIALYEQVVTEPIMMEAEDHHHEAEDHHEAAAESTPDKPILEPDPHVWHSIENTVKTVELIQSTFLQANPPAAAQYLENSVTLMEQLRLLDAWVKDQIATIPEGQKVLVTTHDSLNYYVKAFYLEDYHTLHGLSSESTPTASQMKTLTEEIKQTGVPTIFAESTASDRVLQNVARAAEVTVSPDKLYADGLGEAKNYVEMMSHNTCAIVDGLGGKCQPFAATSQ
ncbi:MAG: metal ABC transporter solute-binding protein, Zn/Mn family [Waterburya sp.]